MSTPFARETLVFKQHTGPLVESFSSEDTQLAGPLVTVGAFWSLWNIGVSVVGCMIAVVVVVTVHATHFCGCV